MIVGIIQRAVPETQRRNRRERGWGEVEESIGRINGDGRGHDLGW